MIGTCLYLHRFLDGTLLDQQVRHDGNGAGQSRLLRCDQARLQRGILERPFVVLEATRRLEVERFGQSLPRSRKSWPTAQESGDSGQLTKNDLKHMALENDGDAQ